MVKIDLHDYYPNEPKGSIIEVTEDVAAALKDFTRQEVARQVKEFRYRAYYSLDTFDGIEHQAIQKAPMPHELLEKQQDEETLYAAIAKLPDKQARRIYARYILGQSVMDIAKAEGVHHSSITESIEQALINLAKILEKS